MGRNFWTFLFFFLGAGAGSFIGALVWRLHKGKDWVKDALSASHVGTSLGFWILYQSCLL